MWFQSKENVGTTFFFIVTMRVEQHEEKRIPLNGRRIGIVYPSEKLKHSLRTTLETLGCSVVHIEDKSATITPPLDIFFVHSSATREQIEALKKISNQVVVLGTSNLAHVYTFQRALTLKNLEAYISTKCSPNPLGNEQVPEERGEEKREEEQERVKALKLNILLAEDNLINQKVIARLLEKMGVRHLTIVDNGKKAVEACQSTTFDLVLMVVTISPLFTHSLFEQNTQDMMMPVMGGCEATEIIRKTIPKERQPMIVALTANAFQESRDECLKAGMDDVFTKPSWFPLSVPVCFLNLTTKFHIQSTTTN
jgi:CheY-like chemotaxis protein